MFKNFGACGLPQPDFADVYKVVVRYKKRLIMVRYYSFKYIE